MNSPIHRLAALTSLLFLCACAAAPQADIKATAASPSAVSGNPAWESSPRSLGPGMGAQFWVWASEGINMIIATPGEKGADLVFKRSHNEGQSFGHDHRINQDVGEVSAHGENNPQLRVGPGIGIYSLWEGTGGIKFGRSMNFGRSFLPPVLVNDDGGKGMHSFFTLETSAQGKVYAAWIDGRDKVTEPPGMASIYLARSDDQGATFNANVKVSGRICPCCRPALTTDDAGNLYMTWRHVFGENERVIVVATSKDEGKTWSQPVRVSQKGWKINGCAHSGPAMKWVDGRLILTWYTAGEGRARLLMAQSTDSGKTFSTPFEIQGTVLDPNHPHIAEVDGEAWVIFQGRDPKQEDGWGPAGPWLVRVGTGNSVFAPQALPFNQRSISYPQLFPGTGGRVYALWTEHTEQGPEVMLVRGRTGSE